MSPSHGSCRQTLVSPARPQNACRASQFRGAAPRPVTSSGVDQPDSLDRLEKLGKLRDSGVISDEELEAKKAELLKRL
jgi:hypothetical protein